jgi:Protein of unknown function (DUF1524)
VRIAAWSVRGLVHGQTGGGEAERVYITAAAEIREGRIDDVDGLRQWFLDRDMLVSSDHEFIRAFKAFQFDRANSHNRVRAILYALEYHRIPTKSALQTRGTLTIEHVSPQSPQPGQWTAFSPDSRSVHTHKLGNLLLIDGPSRANSLLANKDWTAKKRLIKSWSHETVLTTEALELKTGLPTPLTLATTHSRSSRPRRGKSEHTDYALTGVPHTGLRPHLLVLPRACQLISQCAIKHFYTVEQVRSALRRGTSRPWHSQHARPAFAMP